VEFIFMTKAAMLSMKTFPRLSAGNGQRLMNCSRRGFLFMLALDSNPRWLSVVRGAVERLTETLGFQAEQCRSITRAVDEALSNIMRHSYANRLDQPIAVYFRKTRRQYEGEVQRGLEILLCDRGPAIDPSKLHGRPLDDIRPGGLGLHLIHQAMDAVEFARKGPTNRLRLVKYFAQADNAI
jgi:anti-sigma regulatory factor (Ser/Thr protein kinase)